MRNKEGYKDPTAGAAIAHIRREEKRRRKEEENRERKNAEVDAGAIKAASAASNGGKAV
ncbi:MAG: hypothetical protein NC548_26635 [Lachnospiraceae bacterium]|nr:hypothetical protein [Lachnospiraceae bacterium]